LSYDAWGNRRNPATWAIASVTPLFARGFTGHEHLDLFALVNMNGRMYDPVLGRFLSPDPYMQAPDFTQGLNRYIYCLNNPLSLIDPSGYSWLSDNWKTVVASAVAIVVTVVTYGAASGASYAIVAATVAGAAGGAAGAMTGALLNGANFGQIMKAGAVGAFWGAVSSAVSFGVGQLNFGDLVGKMLGHGISQGAVSAASGGKFQHGFFHDKK
jgi:RHS repeat-associated protein